MFVMFVSRLVCARAVEKRLRWPLAHPSRCRRQCSLVCSPVPLFLLQPIHFQPRHSPLRLECFLNISTPVPLFSTLLPANASARARNSRRSQLRCWGFCPLLKPASRAVGERSASGTKPSDERKKDDISLLYERKRTNGAGVEINTQAARDQGQRLETAHARAGGDAECAVWRGPLMARVSPLSGRHRCVSSSSCREKRRVAARGSSAG